MKPKDDSVNLAGLTPTMRAALDRIEPLHPGPNEMVITSGRDGHHMPGSKHPEGNAVDIRTRDLSPPDVVTFRNAVRSALGPDFDVVMESSTTPGSTAGHLHVEWDPRPEAPDPFRV